MSTASPTPRRLARWLPASIGPAARRWGWANLVAQTGIVGTGGLVRLTGSGLGCPTWPRCTADSYVATAEMGIHGVIEFGNRLLTFVLVIIVIGLFLSVVRSRRDRPELFVLTILIGAGIPAQAVIGGISVWTQLNPYVVGLHFVVSVGLVALSTVVLFRIYGRPGPRALAVPGWFFGVTHLMSVAVTVTILVGIVTTGSGPHAGDAGAARNGLDSELLQHIHSWPAYLTLALTVVLLVAAQARRLPPLRWLWALLGVEVVQIVVGIVQARLGLPAFLVGAHMVLACVLAAAMVAVIMSLKQPVRRLDGSEPARVAETV
ncbi:COX15/CtaA family protein [Mycetocola reblochoni]|uniref:COX15/CtaA family protein n=1 Tax=Mycetocola reblochoni TaxID=331618 RepID=UPI003F948196